LAGTQETQYRFYKSFLVILNPPLFLADEESPVLTLKLNFLSIVHSSIPQLWNRQNICYKKI